MSLRIGLVGYGAWGKHHAQAIVKLEGTELAGISGSSESTLAAGASTPRGSAAGSSKSRST